jgi:hypothetical protein
VVGEPEIVVGADHDDLLPVDHHLGILRGFELSEKAVVPTLLQSGFILCSLGTLFKKIH